MNISNVDVKDVVYVLYPYEEDETKTSRRPAIVIDKNETSLEVLVVKVTTHEPRDEQDYKIIEWVKTNLTQPSIARTAKTEAFHVDNVIKKVGTLTDKDYNNIIDIINKYNS